jgi:hypothetical protein
MKLSEVILFCNSTITLTRTYNKKHKILLKNFSITICNNQSLSVSKFIKLKQELKRKPSKQLQLTEIKTISKTIHAILILLKTITQTLL